MNGPTVHSAEPDNANLSKVRVPYFLGRPTLQTPTEQVH